MTIFDDTALCGLLYCTHSLGKAMEYSSLTVCRKWGTSRELQWKNNNVFIRWCQTTQRVDHPEPQERLTIRRLTPSQHTHFEVFTRLSVLDIWWRKQLLSSTDLRPLPTFTCHQQQDITRMTKNKPINMILSLGTRIHFHDENPSILLQYANNHIDTQHSHRRSSHLCVRPLTRVLESVLVTSLYV